MDEPRRVPDARPGEGSRRVQLDGARLQSQAGAQPRHLCRVDDGGAGLRTRPPPPWMPVGQTAWVCDGPGSHEVTWLVASETMPRSSERPRRRHSAVLACFHTVCLNYGNATKS